MAERIYRDSVHNIVRVEIGEPEGDLIARLIDTPEFQRLRRVRQLGLAFFAYQSAEHSRFTHSLGAFHLATRILDRLGTKYQISNGDRMAVRVAALLHDIGHGPFSHVVESILGFHHERFTIDAVLSDDTAVGRLLKEHSSSLACDVAAIIRGDFRNIALSQIVSSQLDADRMDYLLRDSQMTGAKYGIYDLEWIIKSIEIDEEAGHLYVSTGGIYAVEDYLQARYYMFRQVYFHRTLRAAEAVLKMLLRRAIDLYQSGAAFWFRPDSAMERVLRGEHLTLAEHLSLDDNDVLFYIKQWQQSEDTILADLAARFLNRRLFKAVDLDMPETEREQFIDRAREVVEAAGYDPDYYFVDDTGGDAPYYFYTRRSSAPKDLIFVEEGYARPSIREISEVSAAVRGLQKGYRIHRVCFPGELTNEIAKLYHD
ncbi:MAG TPA: HD domain-containing protein [Pyrinomonadaceae bacterium]